MNEDHIFDDGLENPSGNVCKEKSHPMICTADD